MKIIITLAALLFSTFTYSQVGIGTTNPNISAALDVTSTTQGLLPPRMTYIQRNIITTPVAGLLVWCSDCGANGQMQVFNGASWINMIGNPAYFAKPDAPTSPIATAGNAQASIAFSAPVFNGGGTITGYTVTASPSGLTATGSTSPQVVSGLTNGTSYTFTVVATNAMGDSTASSASAAVIPLTIPGAPTGPVATAGNTQASIAFIAPVSNGGSIITGYTVTSTPSSFSATGSASPILVTGLASGTSYTFKVVATNDAGSSVASSASSAVTPAVASGSALCNGTRLTDIVTKTSTTGVIWMDRNLGASRVATASNDYMAYGCLYQWGRGNDGHASMNWSSTTTGVPVNNTFTATQSGTDTPGNAIFIIPSAFGATDWRSPRNDNLWQTTGATNNNPCPIGFHVPTISQIIAEFASGAYNITNSATAYSSGPSGGFKFVLASYRSNSDATVSAQGGSLGVYWSSSINSQYASSRTIYTSSITSEPQQNRTLGYSVRCIKD